jgi:hypothetical protein
MIVSAHFDMTGAMKAGRVVWADAPKPEVQAS